MARALGLSRSTVSEALRDSPRIKPDTALRVRAFAQEAGYRPNPLASALMSEMRRSHAQQFRGVLAAVLLEEPDRPADALSFFRELMVGAKARADHLGFRVEQFLIGSGGLHLSRLDSILRSRGIDGVMLFPAWGNPDFTGLDWSRYAGVYADYFIEHPMMHAVCSDHHRSLTMALHRLHALGYRRPGIFLNLHQDERLQHRWEAAFLAFQRHAEGLQLIPPLVVPELTEGTFVAWFRKHRPDVVVGHHTEAMSWMADCGARIPETHGFFCLNLHLRHTLCAGLDLQPRLIGARAAEIVIAQVQRNERGLPGHVSLTTTSGVWVDGPTVRHVGVPA